MSCIRLAGWVALQYFYATFPEDSPRVSARWPNVGQANREETRAGVLVYYVLSASNLLPGIRPDGRRPLPFCPDCALPCQLFVGMAGALSAFGASPSNTERASQHLQLGWTTSARHSAEELSPAEESTCRSAASGRGAGHWASCWAGARAELSSTGVTAAGSSCSNSGSWRPGRSLRPAVAWSAAGRRGAHRG